MNNITLRKSFSTKKLTEAETS